MSRTHMERVNGGRCVACNGVVVAAWICQLCAYQNEINYVRHAAADRRGPSPTAMSRALQRRNGNAMAYEQWSQLCSMADPGVSPVDGDHAYSTTDGYSRRTIVGASARLRWMVNHG